MSKTNTQSAAVLSHANAMEANKSLIALRALAFAARDRGAHKSAPEGQPFFGNFPVEALTKLLGEKAKSPEVVKALAIVRASSGWQSVEDRGINAVIFAASKLLETLRPMLEAAARAVDAEREEKRQAWESRQRDDRLRWIRNNLSTVNELRKELRRPLETVPEIATLSLRQLDELNQHLLVAERALQAEVQSARTQDERRGIRRAVRRQPAR